jgi:putative spermidine/putrescine transport system permease protein
MPFQVAERKTKGAASSSALSLKNIRIFLPLLPVILYLGTFFIFPMSKVFFDSLKSNSGNWTIQNFQIIFHNPYQHAFITSLKLGMISAFSAAIPGAIFSYLIESRASERLKKLVSSLSGVLSSTGGVPLAFMFIAAIGAQGSATLLLKKIGIDLYSGSFTLFSFTGLVIVYLYFQIPIMVVVFTPAVKALRKEWHEAATNLGADNFKYWTFIGFPILFPSFAASFLLLFANGFSAYATARAMTVGNVALVPLQIGSLVDGNIQVGGANVGKALAMGMVFISALAMVPYLLIQRRTRKWQSK